MQIPEFDIRVFRAVEEPELCAKFMEGHTDVLRYYGVTQVTSANTSWFHNPDAYAIIIEDSETKEILGGIRAHVANEGHPLPLEKAIGEMDPRIFDYIKELGYYKTGEICGLWTSRRVKGMGVSVILMRCLISIINQLRLTSFLGLCSPWTKEILLSLGYVVEESLGEKGTFYYPKEDLLATVIIIRDPDELSAAKTNERELLLDLRRNLKQTKKEKSDWGEFVVNYDLKIKLPGL